MRLLNVMLGEIKWKCEALSDEWLSNDYVSTANDLHTDVDDRGQVYSPSVEGHSV